MNHTAEEVRDLARKLINVCMPSERVERASSMLTAYADLLEQIERAKAGVTDEVVRKVMNAAMQAPIAYAARETRKALQAIAHLLPSGDRREVTSAPKWWTSETNDEPITSERKVEMLLLGYPASHSASHYSIPLYAHQPAQAAQVDAPVGYGLWHCKDKRLGGFVYSTEQAANLQCSPGYKVIRLSAPAPDGGDFCPHGREWAEYCYDEPCNRDAQLNGDDMAESYVCLKCGHQPTKRALIAKCCPNCDATAPTAEPVAKGEASACDEDNNSLCRRAAGNLSVLLSLCREQLHPDECDTVQEIICVLQATHPRPVPDGWALTIGDAIKVLDDVAQFHGQLPVGMYQSIRPRLAAMLASPQPGESS